MDTTKTCTKCGVEKPLDGFCKDRQKSDGLSSWCKQCNADKQREYMKTEAGRKSRQRGHLKYDRSEHGKAKKQEYRQRDYVKAMIKKTQKKHAQSEAGKARIKKYNSLEHVKAMRRRLVREWRESPRGVAWTEQYRKAYRETEHGKQKYREYAKQDRERNPQKNSARKAVRQEVASKRWPAARALTCVECGNQARHYHHHKGYEPEFWLDVIPVCIPCHFRLDAVHTN